MATVCSSISNEQPANPDGASARVRRPGTLVLADRLERFSLSCRAMVGVLESKETRHGGHVVLDYGLWARVERDELRTVARSLGVGVELHYLDVPAETTRQWMDRLVSGETTCANPAHTGTSDRGPHYRKALGGRPAYPSPGPMPAGRLATR